MIFLLERGWRSKKGWGALVWGEDSGRTETTSLPTYITSTPLTTIFPVHKDWGPTFQDDLLMEPGHRGPPGKGPHRQGVKQEDMEGLRLRVASLEDHHLCTPPRAFPGTTGTH